MKPRVRNNRKARKSCTKRSLSYNVIKGFLIKGFNSECKRNGSYYVTGISLRHALQSHSDIASIGKPKHAPRVAIGCRAVGAVSERARPPHINPKNEELRNTFRSQTCALEQHHDIPFKQRNVECSVLRSRETRHHNTRGPPLC